MGHDVQNLLFPRQKPPKMGIVMRKWLFLSLLLPALSSASPSFIGMGVFPGLSWPSSGQSVYGIRINPLVGLHRDVYGLDVGAFNIVKDRFGGVQLGAFNYVKRGTSIIGLQGSFLGNWNRGLYQGVGCKRRGCSIETIREGSCWLATGPH